MQKVLLILVGILVLLAIGSGGFYLGKLSLVSQNITSVSPTPSLKPVEGIELTDETKNWKTYKISTLKIEFKLPPNIASWGDWQERIYKGQRGTQLDFYTEETKVIGDFRIGTTSIDYQQGRGGAFTDFQGYEASEGKYYAKFVNQQRFEIPKEFVKEVRNPYGLTILKVYGAARGGEGEEAGWPVVGTPGKGNIGALINTGDPLYPGLAIYMKLEGNQTEELFDKILSTFKFTDSTGDKIEGRFCGGIGANLPENQCPTGYKCQLDGDYPDAGGKCVKL